MDRFRTMESFVRVVRAGSFTIAASQLGLSRALVSRHVSDLEARLGVRLLNRSTRSLSLTEEGPPISNSASGCSATSRATSARSCARALEPVGTLQAAGAEIVRHHASVRRRHRLRQGAAAPARVADAGEHAVSRLLRFRRARSRSGAVLLDRCAARRWSSSRSRRSNGWCAHRPTIWRAPGGRRARPISAITPAWCMSTSRRTTASGVSRDRRGRSRSRCAARSSRTAR